MEQLIRSSYGIVFDTLDGKHKAPSQQREKIIRCRSCNKRLRRSGLDTWLIVDEKDAACPDCQTPLEKARIQGTSPIVRKWWD